MATLNYKRFGNPSRSYHRARFNIVHKKVRRELSSFILSIKTIVMRATANRAAAARGGWWPRTSRGIFFHLIYAFIYVIGTCMQNFKNIDRKNNHTFFIQSYWTMFLLQTVRI